MVALTLDAPGVLEHVAAAWPSLARSEQVMLAKEHPVFWAMLCSEGRWLPARHLFYIARALMRLTDGRSRRLIISCPPRHGKTAFVWRHFGSWWLGARPLDKVIGVTYQGRQAGRWSIQARDDLARFGPEVFGAGASMRAAAEEWRVLKAGMPTGGLMNAVGSGGALTGKGSNLLLGDDLVKGVAETRNPSVRDALWDWFDQDLLTRFESPDSCAVMVGTRWHDDDVIGRILAAQERGDPPGGYEWEVINLPLLAEDNDPLGRKPGEALWPERWTQDWAERKKRTTPPYSFSALFQGRPVPTSGGIFNRDWVTYYEQQGDELVSAGARVNASHLVRFLTVDPAFSSKALADYTAMAAMGVDPASGRVYVLEVIRKRLEPALVGPAMREAMEKHDIRRVYLEKAGFWSDQIQVIKRQFGLPIIEIQPNTDKVARAMPAADYLSTGRLLFPARAPWLPDFLHELLAFPNGENDDQVDAVSHGVHVATKLRVLKVGGGGQGKRPEEADGWQIGR